MSPTHLTVRDKTTGQPVAIPISSIPEEIRPDNWFNNSYWMYRPDRAVLEPIIWDYLHGAPLEPEEVKKLAQYAFDHACSISVAAWIFSPPEGRAESLNYNRPLIRKLRALKMKAKTRADVAEMISIGMDYALDPL